MSISHFNPVSIRTIASTINGEIIGDASKIVSCLCPIDEPQKNGLTLTKEKSWKKVIPFLKDSAISAILAPKELEVSLASLYEFNGVAVIRVPDPVSCLIKLIPLFYQFESYPHTISEKSEIHLTATLGNNVHVGAFSVIGAHVSTGDNVVIHPQVVIYDNVKIGSHSIIHSGAVIRENCTLGDYTIIQNGAIIGADGFGYVPSPEGLTAIPQVGDVLLGDRVEVGANSCIDRATLGTTKIGLGTKIDNLVQIGHNVQIGQHSLVCGKAGIAGSCKIGSRVVIGADAGIKDHIMIGDTIRIGAKAGVITDLENSGDYAGFPAVSITAYRRQIKAIQELPRVMKKFLKDED